MDQSEYSVPTYTNLTAFLQACKAINEINGNIYEIVNNLNDNDNLKQFRVWHKLHLKEVNSIVGDIIKSPQSWKTSNWKGAITQHLLHNITQIVIKSINHNSYLSINHDDKIKTIVEKEVDAIFNIINDPSCQRVKNESEMQKIFDTNDTNIENIKNIENKITEINDIVEAVLKNCIFLDRMASSILNSDSYDNMRNMSRSSANSFKVYDIGFINIDSKQYTFEMNNTNKTGSLDYILRPDQIEVIEKIINKYNNKEGDKECDQSVEEDKNKLTAMLAKLPTGYGKTFIMSLLQNLPHDKDTFFAISPTAPLASQLQAKISEYGNIVGNSKCTMIDKSTQFHDILKFSKIEAEAKLKESLETLKGFIEIDSVIFGNTNEGGKKVNPFLSIPNFTGELLELYHNGLFGMITYDAKFKIKNITIKDIIVLSPTKISVNIEFCGDKINEKGGLDFELDKDELLKVIAYNEDLRKVILDYLNIFASFDDNEKENQMNIFINRIDKYIKNIENIKLNKTTVEYLKSQCSQNKEESDTNHTERLESIADAIFNNDTMALNKMNNFKDVLKENLKTFHDHANLRNLMAQRDAVTFDSKQVSYSALGFIGHIEFILNSQLQEKNTIINNLKYSRIMIDEAHHEVYKLYSLMLCDDDTLYNKTKEDILKSYQDKDTTNYIENTSLTDAINIVDKARKAMKDNGISLASIRQNLILLTATPNIVTAELLKNNGSTIEMFKDIKENKNHIIKPYGNEINKLSGMLNISSQKLPQHKEYFTLTDVEKAVISRFTQLAFNPYKLNELKYKDLQALIQNGDRDNIGQALIDFRNYSIMIIDDDAERKIAEDLLQSIATGEIPKHLQDYMLLCYKEKLTKEINKLSVLGEEIKLKEFEFEDKTGYKEQFTNIPDFTGKQKEALLQDINNLKIESLTRFKTTKNDIESQKIDVLLTLANSALDKIDEKVYLYSKIEKMNAFKDKIAVLCKNAIHLSAFFEGVNKNISQNTFSIDNVDMDNPDIKDLTNDCLSHITLNEKIHCNDADDIKNKKSKVIIGSVAKLGTGLDIQHIKSGVAVGTPIEAILYKLNINKDSYTHYKTLIHNYFTKNELPMNQGEQDIIASIVKKFSQINYSMDKWLQLFGRVNRNSQKDGLGLWTAFIAGMTYNSVSNKYIFGSPSDPQSILYGEGDIESENQIRQAVLEDVLTNPSNIDKVFNEAYGENKKSFRKEDILKDDDTFDALIKNLQSINPNTLESISKLFPHKDNKSNMDTKNIQDIVKNILPLSELCNQNNQNSQQFHENLINAINIKKKLNKNLSIDLIYKHYTVINNNLDFLKEFNESQIVTILEKTDNILDKTDNLELYHIIAEKIVQKYNQGNLSNAIKENLWAIQNLKNFNIGDSEIANIFMYTLESGKINNNQLNLIELFQNNANTVKKYGINLWIDLDAPNSALYQILNYFTSYSYNNSHDNNLFNNIICNEKI